MNIFRPTLARLLLVVPLLAAGIALGAPAPAAAATICDTTQTGPTSKVIKDSVVVKAGTTCSLFGSQIRGGVTVEPGAHFHFETGTEIRGSVTATAPGSLILFDTVVRGSVTITGGTSVGALTIRDTQVRGDLVVTGNTYVGVADPLFVGENTVRGSLVLQNNTSTTSIRVLANIIDINLDCSDNTPAPIMERGFGPEPNTVGGVATDQCAGLVAP